MFNFHSPVDEETLQPLRGRAVCIILEDGTEFTGILTSCGPKTLVLNGERTQRPGRKRKARVTTDNASLADNAMPEASSYWGALGLRPPIERSNVKAVIPLAQIRSVLLI
jgi:small nuclear ribonucleoprotein (snRNP)-like protein